MLNDFDLETALNNTVVNNANQKKDSYGFVVDNSGEVTPVSYTHLTLPTIYSV